MQLIDRVTWDDIVVPPGANELGWKGTVRVSPLEDTIVALRPVVPTSPSGAGVSVAAPLALVLSLVAGASARSPT